MKKLLIAIALLVVLAGGAIFSGLADPLIEWRVKTVLVDAGLSEPQAACMAGRMTGRLTPIQLWKLRQGLAAQGPEPVAVDGLGELVKRLDRIGDSEVVAVLTTSAGLCAIGLG
jgi:hypothetical protein